MTGPDWFAQGWEHIWLPYTQMKTVPMPQKVARTQGCKIFLEDGRELIDGIASWWSAAHGYNHPHILACVEQQLKTMPHVMFGGLAHEPAYRLAGRLSAIAPAGLSRVFFSDSGSVAVEVALKIALQYWKSLGKTGKERFICFTGGYHGDTFAAMSLSDPDHSMHKAFRHSVIHQYVMDIPADEYSFGEFDAVLSGIHKDVAGIIIEPLVQGAGGMRFHEPDVLAEIHRIAKKHDLLFIADEIATGFGRTGSMFACNEAGISPDIMCVGKALTGGTITLAATLAREEIFAAFLSDDQTQALMHGPTFMGNALACAAANASLDLFEREPRLKQIEAIETQLREELKPCEGLPGVIDVRVKGAIGVVQIEESKMDYYGLRAKFLERGCWVRPFKDIIYLTPPFTISSQELSQLTGAVAEVTREL